MNSLSIVNYDFSKKYYSIDLIILDFTLFYIMNEWDFDSSIR